MQRSIPSQLVGISKYYHEKDKFFYIKVTNNSQDSLAYRAGIRNFDRFISLNGINIENDTMDQLDQRFQTQLHLPVQMLVCSPSTYHHYKSNNLIIHSHLPTVQHLKPVFDLSCKTIYSFFINYFFYFKYQMERHHHQQFLLLTKLFALFN